MLPVFKATLLDISSALSLHSISCAIAWKKSEFANDSECIAIITLLDKIQTKLSEMMQQAHDIMMYHSVRHLNCDEFDQIYAAIFDLYLRNSEFMEFGEFIT